MKKFPGWFCSLALLAGLVVRGADPAPVTHDYLAPGAVDFRRIVPPPPAEDSLPAEADHEVAVDLDADRTPTQAALARHYEKFTVFTLLADVLGPWCTPENLPRTQAVFAEAARESRPIIEEAKASWNRARPFVFNPSLHPAIDKPVNTSYPSGHAFASSHMAVLLAAALPGHADDWRHQAALVRWSRVAGGAHYPSDVIAGKVLGEAVGREMLKSPQLQQALAEVRAEIEAHMPPKAG